MQVLEGLPKFVDANALVGTETADDAAVYRLDDRTAIVQTVDFFSPIVDDPFSFGQIAAANSLSDLYAMGARPLFALNIAGFPNGTLPLEVLQEILRGGASKAREAEIPILGGHTVTNEEPLYGLVATGIVAPEKVTRNAGARVGDQLVLTKPLGTGIVSNAAKKQKCPPATLEAAVASMATLNRAGAAAVEVVGVSACTDVTGFGFIGHLSGMLKASGVAARVFTQRFPLLPEVMEFIAAGFVPGGTKRNQAFYADRVEVRGASEAAVLIANDAQTSGGLLISVPAEKLGALIAELQRQGTPAAAHIGEIVEGEAGRVVLE